jgi:hypothetical protein
MRGGSVVPLRAQNALRRLFSALRPFRSYKRAVALILSVAVTLTSAPMAPSAWAATPPTFPANAPFEFGHVHADALSVPENLGRIVEWNQPADRSPNGLVIHIQDLHTHAEAQSNISRLIS